MIECQRWHCRATLSWYDPPNVDGTTGRALLQNLDLLIVAPDGQAYWGNGGSSADVLNTVEHIEIDNTVQGSYQVCSLS